MDKTGSGNTWTFTADNAKGPAGDFKQHILIGIDVRQEICATSYSISFGTSGALSTLAFEQKCGNVVKYSLSSSSGTSLDLLRDGASPGPDCAPVASQSATPATATPAPTATPPAIQPLNVSVIGPHTIFLPGSGQGADAFPTTTSVVALNTSSQSVQVFWSTSDPAVATIDNTGRVTASVSTGSTTISAISLDGLSRGETSIVVMSSGAKAIVEVD